MKIKLLYSILVGLLISFSSFAQQNSDPLPPAGQDVVIGVNAWLEFNIEYPNVDFKYDPSGQGTNATWDTNNVNIFGNVPWDFNVYADAANLTNITDPSSTDVIPVSKIALSVGSTSLGNLSTSYPSNLKSGSMSDSFILEYDLDISTLGSLRYGSYQVSLTYSVTSSVFAVTP
ncbi:hypothetical protein [Ancylomarina longa]|uniref:Uncharacterized protein n=1 Tax=Ancylomarina longa TaxID=2487017 RepID=A0A434AGY4_9BACT|nr:hypothetical protein [Ancylomarina longa]RUT73655.1 hypothetical protein DLK05_12580 [Ancylomarina longa]